MIHPLKNTTAGSGICAAGPGTASTPDAKGTRGPETSNIANKGTAGKDRRLGIANRKANAALVMFVAISLLVSMSISQLEAPEVGSLSYWLLLGAAGLLPLLDIRAIVKTLTGRARSLLLFGLIAGAWHGLQGDERAVLQIGLMVWVLAWLSSDAARLSATSLVRIYGALVVIGIGVWLVTDLNNWSLVPGAASDENGVWRVSFFPNIANTAILSLAVILVLTRSPGAARAHPFVLGAALYFVIFSFVRTALIALVLYTLMRWWLGLKRRSPKTLFWSALLVAIGVNIALASSVVAINYLQDIPLFSRLLLRGETGLAPEEIFQQLYRPWLWWQHLTLFSTSPSLMGWGAFDFAEMQLEELNVGTTPGGNEALITRLMANFGLPAFILLYYLLSRLRASARGGDTWACACFPSIFLLMMQWGNVFHPTDANGAIFWLMLIHGSSAFGGASRRRTAPAGLVTSPSPRTLPAA